MQKITPHVWFDKEAVEAAEFYTSIFPDSKITMKQVVKDTPSGDSEIVGFDIMGYSFMAISAGPIFKINPSISFHVKCKSVEEVDEIWNKLSPDGKVMMELGEYPFSKRYGWVQDKFGVSWQIIYTEGEFTQRITPVLLFTQTHAGHSEEAGNFYAGVFSDASYKVFMRYGADAAPEQEGTVQYSQLTVGGQEFGLMDSKQPHEFIFNEAVSLIINCKNQAEIDYFWEKLSAVPESEQCGWVKDKYGVSWQIIPENMGQLLGKNPEKTVPAMLKMKKIVIAELEQAGE
jgi:predicted 3-demethylubiquinone-9 3-methyltransferase (glyoxalase superfamily)